MSASRRMVIHNVCHNVCRKNTTKITKPTFSIGFCLQALPKVPKGSQSQSGDQGPQGRARPPGAPRRPQGRPAAGRRRSRGQPPLPDRPHLRLSVCFPHGSPEGVLVPSGSVVPCTIAGDRKLVLRLHGPFLCHLQTIAFPICAHCAAKRCPRLVQISTLSCPMWP